MIMRIRKIDSSIEERIITGLIVSTKFCRDISHLIKPDYFTTSYSKIICQWCLDYYSKFKEAPDMNINSIFKLESGSLTVENEKIMSGFLSKLSDSHEQDQSFNSEYLFDKSLQYFKERSLKLMTDKMQDFLDAGKINEAESELEKYKNVRSDISNWINPFTKEEIKKFFLDEEDKSQYLFKLPGHIGELIGPLERDNLFSVLAPLKRGKTFWLQEMAVQALVERLRVAFITLEMSPHKTEKRIYRRLTALGDVNKEYVYPCFDCIRNQNNSCRRSERVCRIGLILPNGKKPKYSKAMDYVPCTSCRGKKNFIAGTWSTTIKRDRMSHRNVDKIISGLVKMYGNNFRFISYPAFSANITQIKNDLNRLEDKCFIPDVIVVDYADILAPEDRRILGRERSDETWKMLKNLADTKHCLLLTASQSNRPSFKKKFVTQVDIAEDIRKGAHVDGMMALNQTDEEKHDGVLRVSLIVDREGYFDQYRSCYVLQNLDLAQSFLDSEFVPNIDQEGNQMNSLDDSLNTD